jgi:hypothetical protein
MPAILFPTTNAATVEERTESRDRDFDPLLSSVLHLFAKNLLCGM